VIQRAPKATIPEKLKTSDSPGYQMGTTSLIVEMVIIGFQVLVWMSLIVLILFGYRDIDPAKLKDWSAIISLALVGTSYTLGLVFNGFIGSVFAHSESSLWKSFVTRSGREGRRGPAQIPTDPGQMRAYITAFNSDASEDLTSEAHRHSLIRATSLNLVLIGITSLVWVTKQYGFWLRLDLAILLSSLLLIGLSLFTWFGLSVTYYWHLCSVYDAMKESQEKDASGREQSAPKAR
jgi:hypothetical protein